MRYAKFLTFLALISLSSTCNLWCQSKTFIQLTTDTGLPSNEIYEAFQDDKGFIWFATDNGIVKYDGIEMQVFTSRDGLSDPVVFNFQEDDAGKIWLRTYSGRLSYIDNDKIIQYPFNDIIAENIQNRLINFYYSASKKELHFIVNHLRGAIDSTGTLSTTPIPVRAGFYYYSIEGKQIWKLNKFNSDEMDFYLDNKKFQSTFSQANYSFKEYYGESRLITWRDRIYFSIRNHLFEYHNNAVNLVHVGKAPIISLSTDNVNTLWVGYLNLGFERFNSSQFNNILQLPELDALSITSVLHDQDNGFWITTLEKGAFYYPNLEINNFLISDNTKITSVYNRKDTVVISTQQGDLFIYDGQKNKLLHSKKFNSPVHNTLIDPHQTQWVYAASWITLFDKNFKQIRQHKAQASSFSIDTDGVWTLGAGSLKKFNWQGDLVYTDTLPYVYRAMALHDTIFYLAGRTGLEIKDKSFDLRETLPEFNNLKISSIAWINDSIGVLATIGNGLILINKQNRPIANYNAENQFIANNIYELTLADSVLWLGTEKGAVMMTKTSLINAKPKFSQWNKNTGLIGDIIRNIIVTSESVWAFSENGYSIIPKNQLYLKGNTPIPYIKSLEINDSLISSINKITLPHNQTKINLTLGFLSFRNKDINLRYRLNRNDPWVPSKNKALQFNSLAPGAYEIEIQFTDDNVVWNTINPVVKFYVESPWWLRWYSIVLEVGIIFIIVILFFKRRLSLQKKQNELLQMINKQQTELVHAEVVISEKERKRLAKELHDSIGTQLTAIKLNVVNILNNRTQPDDLKKIDAHLQHTIDEVRSMAYSLTPPEIERYGLFTALSNHFDKITQTSGIRVDFSTYGADIQANELSISIFRILQELSSNTLKHTKAKNIKVTINSFEQTVNILYEDDGGGFDPEKAKNGLGLSNIISRVGAIGGTSNFESTAFGVSYVFEFPKNEL
ncbi:MAG: two-component regulator propeller domain-containing protein [Cyclobacteriaceae bacterium]|nr:MAG: two-component regulator propeller domain-containing protein [Cyclobacteriaceae bacterium]